MRRWSGPILLAAFSALIAVSACGGGDGTGPPTTQTGTVQGFVRDQNGAAVASATVTLSATGQTPRTAQTNATGRYTFAGVAPGAWTVTVTVPTGYTAGAGGTTASVTVAAGQTVNATAIVLNNASPPSTFVDVVMRSSAF